MDYVGAIWSSYCYNVSSALEVDQAGFLEQLFSSHLKVTILKLLSWDMMYMN